MIWPTAFDYEDVKRSDRALAYLELEKDPVFPHLTKEQRLYYVDFALRVGHDQAALFHGADVFGLAREFGLKVDIQKAANTVAGVTLRACYDEKKRTVEIFGDSIEQMQQELAHWLPWPLTFAQIAALHLAHELFHHLEATRIQPVDRQLPSVTIWRFGRFGITIQSRARRCREIAAHAFAKRMCDFPFFPNALDLSVTVAGQEPALSQLQNSLKQAQLITGCSPRADLTP